MEAALKRGGRRCERCRKTVAEGRWSKQEERELFRIIREQGDRPGDSTWDDKADELAKRGEEERKLAADSKVEEAH